MKNFVFSRFSASATVASKVNHPMDCVLEIRSGAIPELFSHTVTASKDSGLGAKVSATFLADQCCPYLGELGWDTSIRYSSAFSRLFCLSATLIGSTSWLDNVSCLSQPKGTALRFSCRIWVIGEGAAMTLATKAKTVKRVGRIVMGKKLSILPEAVVWRGSRVPFMNGFSNA